MGTERIINAGDKTRASNIEILRIIAMFFILFIHAIRQHFLGNLKASLVHANLFSLFHAFSHTFFLALFHALLESVIQ